MLIHYFKGSDLNQNNDLNFKNLSDEKTVTTHCKLNKRKLIILLGSQRKIFGDDVGLQGWPCHKGAPVVAVTTPGPVA